MTDNDRDRDESGLDAAKRKLSEMQGRPFDVDAVLAKNRAKEERQRLVAREAERRIERERGAARERRESLKLKEIEAENRVLSEHEQRLEEAKKGEQRRLSGTKDRNTKDKDASR